MTSKDKLLCKLALEDGTVFVGTSFGGRGTRFGEVVFNTSMMGYQEILTDPSYRGQIVVMTCPQIGNYGVTDEDVESTKPWVEGFAVKELARRHSNFRAGEPLEDYLARHGVISIEGIDTRALTRRLRLKGSLKGVISTETHGDVDLVRVAAESPDIVGKDMVKSVAPSHAFDWKRGFESPFAMQPRNAQARFTVVALDFGIKQNILRNLVEAGCRVLVVPPTESAQAILQRTPDGVFLSNGPGDPEPVRYARETIAQLVGKVPIFGICLGHQLLGMALGADRYKLKFGHHGGNQPVKNLATGRVEITAQNHCYAIDTDSLRKVGGVPTHVNLNDQTLEGFTHPDVPLFSVQYHPEASPGPHDASYLFDCFVDMMTGGRAPTAEQMADAQKRLESRR
ncbi:MAG TPA: glutamine-hydrolyzing carbamoyl-phosphate synthase small subunit [Phycisphaerae bacterium]|nr:glutamine-hydrolyzing carbamoyl-phosphate synthase small subunit [Phycisphaerae bacterium]